jgi:hypothetical protein
MNNPKNNPKLTFFKNWVTILLTALMISGILTGLLNVGTALASVSWNF